MQEFAMPIHVKFTGEGGYPSENKRAREELEVGRTYGLYRLDVGRSSSSVTVADLSTWMPIGTYNSIMFNFLSYDFVDWEDIEEEKSSLKDRVTALENKLKALASDE